MKMLEEADKAIEILKNTGTFFATIDDIEKMLNTQLTNKEAERDDLLHEIEISKLNAIEIMNVYKKLEKVLHERREIKDRMLLMGTLKGYSNKYITKGILADTRQAIQNVETLKKNIETRKYTPRILKDLKCARTKNKEEEQ